MEKLSQIIIFLSILSIYWYFSSSLYFLNLIYIREFLFWPWWIRGALVTLNKNNCY